ncbi:unnamed protein product [Diplocarpon coronariae]
MDEDTSPVLSCNFLGTEGCEFVRGIWIICDCLFCYASSGSGNSMGLILDARSSLLSFLGP